MRRMFAAGLCAVVCWLAAGQAAAQSQSIIASPHNLSVMGPGNVVAASEQQICIFCHTPHHASDVQPLWNRNAPVSAYRPYASNSLQATPGQPTGSSKLCLSCHDGTIALGNVLSRNQTIAMAGGMTTLPPGKSNLGTDLSDDHPISFRYDTELAGKNTKLKSPNTVSSSTRLDANRELQCTSCHEPHNNRFGKFLVMDNSGSQLCKSCHQQGHTAVAEHADCRACHQSHTAPSGPYLLKGATVTSTCISCHSSAPSPTKGTDIASELAKLCPHNTNSPVNLKNHIPDNVGCADCHEPHTMGTDTPAAPLASTKHGRVSGVNISGAPVPQVQYGYEVCFKCHADNGTTKITPKARQVTQPNVRLQFLPTATSFHPVAGPGRSNDVPSLIAPLNTSSIIACTDCHASESSATATGPKGPHGSNNKPLLIAGYETADNTSESAAAYALCYRCHDRNSILSDQSFSKHRMHIVDKGTPCSVCHDSHGITQLSRVTSHAHLINFDTKVVQPDPATNRIRYTVSGPRAGTCTLTCHGKVHSATPYGGGAAPMPAAKGLSLPSVPGRTTLKRGQ